MYGMKIKKTFRLSEEAVNKLKNQANQSQYVEDLILGGSLFEAYVTEMLEKLVNRVEAEPVAEDVAKKVSNPYVKQGYVCCSNPSPCKHWSFDGVEDNWVNSITGERRNG
jgi:predicted DNA-binding protein